LDILRIIPEQDTIYLVLPDQRNGFWAAISRGLFALVGTLIIPLYAVSAVLMFAFAWGIRRGQMWAAIAATAFAFIPLAALFSQADVSVAAVAIAISFEMLFGWFFVRAALALSRAGGGTSGRWGWTALIVACGAFWIVFRMYSIPSASMEDTILLNEDILVRRIVGAPGDGDLVVFHYPVDPRETFTKRVVGVPGDRLRLIGKQLIRNGAPVAEPYAKHLAAATDQYRDNFPAPPMVALPAPGAAMLERNVRDGELVVPVGEYFVLGDNRDDSLDSRYWGFVARDQIIGKPVLVYASYQLGKTPPTMIRSILNTRWRRLLRPL
jgi:signal peptidase I